MMLRNLLQSLLLFFMLVLSYGCGQDEAPISVELGEQYNSLLHTYIPRLMITSLVDSVTITNVIVNKGVGECKFRWFIHRGKDMREVTLKYGEVTKNVLLSSACNNTKILQVEIETNLGSWVFSW